MARVLRRILGDEETPRVFGRILEVENFGGGIEVTLRSGAGIVVEFWTVDTLLLLDPSIVEISPKGIVAVKAVLPRILSAIYDEEEDSLRVAEVEPQALIPG